MESKHNPHSLELLQRPSEPSLVREEEVPSTNASLNIEHAVHTCLTAFCLGNDRDALGPVLKQLLEDIGVLDKSLLPGWVKQLNELFESLVCSEAAKLDLVKKAQEIRAGKAGMAQSLLWVPKRLRSPLRFLQWRCLACLTALSETGRHLKNWLSLLKREAKDLPPTSGGKLEEFLRSRDPAQDEIRALIVRVCSGKDLATPFQLAKKKHGEVFQRVAIVPKVSSSVPEPTITTSPKDAERQDLLRWHKAEIANAGMRVFSGVPDLYDYLRPSELEAGIKEVLAWRSGQNHESYLCVLLTLFGRVMPSRYFDVPLEKSSSPAVWLDLDKGGFAWNLSQVIASHNGEEGFQRGAEDVYVHIPLPHTLVQDLRDRVTVACHSVGDLLGEQIPEIAKRTKAFLRLIAASPHRPTLKRLSHSWGRYLLDFCRDEAYASALSMDFTLGTTANFNYLRLQGGRVLTILNGAYRKLGLGECSCEGGLPDVGGQRALSFEEQRALLLRCMREIREQFGQLPKNATKGEIVKCHNKIALRVYACSKLVSGTRAQQEECLTAERIELEHGFMLVSDKRTSHYHLDRLLGIPSRLRDLLRFYEEWLHLLSWRMDRFDRGLAKNIMLSVAGESDCPLPWFFRITDKGDPEPLGASDLAEAFEGFHAAGNAGRHTVDRVLRDAGMDSAAIMAWAGRGNPGQELFGPWSLAIPDRWARACAEKLDEWIGELDLPLPPKLKARRLTSEFKPKPQKFVPAVAKTLPPSLVSSDKTTQCPFPESLLSDLKKFERLKSHWRKRGMGVDWVGIACSLVVEDGVCMKEELTLTLEAMDRGEICRVGAHHFVDVSVPSYGIRRVWLSYVTKALLFRYLPIREPFPGAQALEEKIRVELNDHGIDGITQLTATAKAFLTICLPALLSRWCCGALVARTTRKESIARHLTNRVEPAQVGWEVTRERRIFSDLASLLSAAEQMTKDGRTDEAARIWLKERTVKLAENLLPDCVEWFETGYVNYLAGKKLQIATIRSYANHVIRHLVRAKAQLKKSGFSQVDWAKLFAEAAPSESAAIGHFQKWIGVAWTVSRAVEDAAHKYAETLSKDEGEAAFEYLMNASDNPGDICERAAILLRLLLFCPMRWNEVISLRVCDVFLGKTESFLVVTPEAGSNLKSENAKRIIPFNDIVLVEGMCDLQRRRRQQHPGREAITLFGDLDDNDEVMSKERIETLLFDALRTATGNQRVRVHDLRHTAINSQIEALLDGERKWYDFLEQRQAVFAISARAGHGMPETTFKHYVQGLDWARRRWLDRVNPQETSSFGYEFLVHLTGKNYAALRKEQERKGSVALLRQEELLLTGVDLADGLLPRPTSLSVSVDRVDAIRRGAIFLGVHLLGDSLESAAQVAGLTLAEAKSISRRLEQHLSVHGVAKNIREGIRREAFLGQISRMGLVEGLAVQIQHETASQTLLRQICARSFPLGAAIPFASYTDLVDLKNMVIVFDDHGVVPVVLVQPENSSEASLIRSAELRAAGFERIVRGSKRRFSSFRRALLEFQEKNNVGNINRASKQTNFLVGVSLLAIHLTQENT